MKNKIFFYICFFVMVVGLYIFISQKLKPSMSDEGSKTLKPESKASTVKGLSLSSAPDDQVNTAVTPLSDEEFTNWIVRESQSIEGRVQGVSQVEAEIQAQARRLSDMQIKQLKAIIENKDEPINKRIFSNYVLTQTFSPLADEILKDMAEQSTEEFKQPQPTHSVGEVLRSQQYALKFMQIDEIVQRIQKNGQDPLVFLIELNRKSNDDQVKAYTVRKIKLITNQK